MTKDQTATSGSTATGRVTGRETGGLDLSAALGEAARTLPAMWRGAGGVLAATALLGLAAIHRPGGWPATIALILTLAAGLAAFGATTRIGVAREVARDGGGDLAGARRLGLGPFGFQMTRVEARLLGASALCGLFFVIMLSLLALVALALFGGAGLDAQAVQARDWAAVGPAWKLVLLAGVGLIVLGAPVVLAVRLSLFAPATVGRGQMISLTATGLTNGSMWALLGGLIVCSVPTILCLALATAGLFGGAGPAIWLVLFVAVQAPMTAGFLGAAYRRLETHAMLGAWQ